MSADDTGARLPRGVAACRAAWMGLLLLPAATSASAWHDWDIAPQLLLAVSCWWVLVLRVMVPGRAFFVLTYPIAAASLACLTADLMRQVNALDLAAQWPTFTTVEWHTALRPYAWHAMAGAAALVVWAWVCMRGAKPVRPPRWHLRAGVVAAGTALCALVAPAVAWTRAWPASAAVVAASAATGQADWAGYAVAGAGGDPGRPDARWGATGSAPVTEPETLVLVIGESLRADALRECGGPSGVQPVAAGAIVACDVTAGSDATHTSVPLLVGRSWPGLRTRIPADSTFQKPLEHLGFHTAWIATQGPEVAWPDARVRHFGTGPDRQVLLPALDSLMASHPGRLSVVLHMTGAHEPYCERFDRSRAPFGDACGRLGEQPTAATLPAWHAMYANAADESVGFLNTVIDRLSRAPGRVFLAFTPDHGENLLDDARGLYGHALRTPTVWDIRVPVVFWANAAWKGAHAAGWRQLQANASRPLMHADVVPTLLEAVDVRYDEPRPDVRPLLTQTVEDRQRVVQASIGSQVRYGDLRVPAGNPAAVATFRSTQPVGPARTP